MEKIFIGGWGGSGTRVIVEILKRGGYYIAEEHSNYVYDFGSMNFVDAFDSYYLDGNFKQLSNLFSKFDNRESWAIKHGHLMYIIPKLKSLYPNSKFIYIERNVIDNALAVGYKPHIKYGKYPLNSELQDKVNYMIEEGDKSIKNSDLVIKLEELCESPELIIPKILALADITGYDILDYTKLVITPKTIGRGKEHYSKIKIRGKYYEN